jgi:hypothetical protein
MAATTTDFLRRERLAIAQTLERIFTPRKKKRAAAILLRNAAIEVSHCKFCGNVPYGTELHESLFDPTVQICGYCAWYIGVGRKKLIEKDAEWILLKHFAP